MTAHPLLGQILVCAWRQGMFSLLFMVILFLWSSIYMNNNNINEGKKLFMKACSDFYVFCILFQDADDE
jgi:hypothetical protein